MKVRDFLKFLGDSEQFDALNADIVIVDMNGTENAYDAVRNDDAPGVDSCEVVHDDNGDPVFVMNFEGPLPDSNGG